MSSRSHVNLTSFLSLIRIIDPIMHGDYPITMRSMVKSRLPEFTEEQSKILKGSTDFIGLNYYTTRYAEDSTSNNTTSINWSYATDDHVDLTGEWNN